MTEERIDIVITDKIAPSIGEKLRLIAMAARDGAASAARLQAALSSIKVGTLTQLSASNIKAALANERLAQAAAKTALAQQKVATEVARTNRVELQSLQIKNNLATAEARLTTVRTAGVAAQRVSNLVAAQGNVISRQGRQNLINLSYQLNDIAVGFASGQRPFTIFAQQLPQIAQIFAGSGGIIASLKAFGGALVAIATPIAGFLAGIGAVLGGLFILQREINKTSAVQVSFYNTLKATIQVIARDIIASFSNVFSGLTPIVTSTYNLILTISKQWVNGVIAIFVFLRKAIPALFFGLPEVMGDLFVKAFNLILRSADSFANYFVDIINKIIEGLNRLPTKDKLTLIPRLDLSRFQVETKGFQTTADALKQAAADAQKAVDTDAAGRLFNRIKDQAVANQLKDNAEAAKKNNAELSDYEKFLQDINGPLIDMQKQVPLIARALREKAITLEQATKRMNELRLAVLELSTDLNSGLQAGLIRVQEQFGNVASVASDLVVNSFKSAEDALVSFVSKGKLDFKGLVDSMIADLARLAIRQNITAPIANALGVGGGASSFGSFVLGNLPSFDVGTSRVPRDMIAKIHKDEMIIPASQSREIRAGNGSSGNGITIVNQMGDIIISGGANDNGDQAARVARAVQTQLEQSMARFTQQQQKIGGMLNRNTVVA